MSELADILKEFLNDQMRNIHTIKPSVVTNVNYSNNTVDVQPLTKTRYEDEVQIVLPVVQDVPLLVLSANTGGARITFPVKVGDTVVVLFSDRDIGDLLSTPGKVPRDSDSLETHPLEGIMALPCFFTAPTSKTIDSENIIIENGSSYIELEPSGDINIDGPTNINIAAGSDVNIDANGNTNITTGSDTIIDCTNAEVNASASVDINSPATNIVSPAIGMTGIVDVTGPVIASGGISTGGVPPVAGYIAGTYITAGTLDLGTHRHVETGTGYTGPPVPGP